MKTLIRTVVAGLCAAALPASAETETYTVDPNHTFPAFEIGHLGYSIQRGRFNKTSGKITVDTAAQKGSADITIDMGSISTGHPKLEEHLKSEEFFDAAKFPTMTFKADHFAFEGDNVKSASGTLTLHGVSRPVTLKTEYFRCAPHPMLKKKVCGADFSGTIKRSEFGVSRGVPAVADEVNLRINVEAIRD
jgi:polyisoprenoid-binding protein YceI